MSSSAITCPKCLVRLRVGAGVAEGQAFSCPKCGHVVAPDGGPRSSHKGLLIGLIAAILLAGGGIVTAIVLTRTPPPDKTPDSTLASTQQDDAAKEAAAKAAIAKDKERQAEEDKAKKADEEKRRQDYVRWMIEGGTAANAKQWAEAFAAYQEALKSAPGDVEAARKLGEAKTALDALAQAKAGDDKTLADVKKLLEQADEALSGGKYAAAAAIYKLALQTNPGDTAAVKGLIAAEDGLTKDQAERKKLDDFQKHLAAAQAAFKNGRYGDAVAEAMAAQQVLPKNAQAAAVQRDAQRKLDQDKDRKEQKAEFDRLVDQAAASQRNGDFKAAIDGFEKALKLFPDDQVARSGLENVRKGQKSAQFEFDLALARGNAAMRDARFKDAIVAFGDALRLLPGNEDAQRGLAAATAADANRAGYFAAMKRGNFALRLADYTGAINAFNDALRLVPFDPLARAGLLEAQQGLAELQRLTIEFDKKVKIGTQAKNQRKFDDAARAFKDALKIFPGSPQADLVGRLHRYSDAMGDGTKALTARNRKEAIRQFQRALEELPNDPVARAALIQAQALPASKM